MNEKILFIAHRIPYPPDKGDKIRSFNELNFFSKHYSIDLVAFYDQKKDFKHLNYLEKICSHVFLYYRHPRFSLLKGLFSLFFGGTISIGSYKNSFITKRVQHLCQSNNYKFIFCYSSQTAQYAVGQTTKKIIDFIDVDSDKWKQYSGKSNFLMKYIYLIESKRLSNYEKHISDRFSLSLFSTKNELNLFNKYNRKLQNNTVLSNGVDYDYFMPISCSREKSLIFTGAMDYYPNIDAVEWFSKEVFPCILAKVPDLTFYIVGSNPVSSVKNLASKNIIITGYVEDIRPYIARSALAVFPLRIARGIQNKFLETMSMGITPLIPDYLKNSLDEHLPDDVLFYSSKKDCIQKVISVLSKFHENSKYSLSLRKYIIKNRDWQKRFEKLHNQINSLPQ
jgi:polysaccharide biosynthesis protein PslH